ncbi:BTAD domain-containing putative transcriptional regulator [Kribbella sp. NPDC051137]|uniref:AfsR/SARP family transcriptional regulator n=1 Tax=Kribbella sp. NPDC051137 TaxID=3155045 RepID=UPI00343270A4
MRFRILGSVGVVAGQSELVIPGERVRTLLAALLLRADQVVPAEQLLYDVWGEDLPANPRSAMQAAVSRLRQATGAEVQHAYGGYRIALDGHELDLTQFRDRVASASAADAEERLDLLTAALRLHQGDVLRGASTGTLARRFGPGLRDEWLDVREQRAEALLLLGQVDGAAAELVALTNDSPLRERAWLFLLQALQAAGRTAEALAAYEKVRQLLADELGADPSPELRDLHQQLLDSERAAAWTARTRLPLPVTGFIGRDDETAKALDLLTQDDGLPVLLLSGLPGVGKSALATRIAHAAKHRFPDGQWFVRLRDRPADAVVGELLGYCGISASAVPDSPRARTETYREALAGRRVLLVLDDAMSAADVHALLPNSAGCAVVVTSRQSLADLSITAGASGMLLAPLTPDQSTTFLRTTGEFAAAGAAEELSELCAGLPLALRIAAAGARMLPPSKLAAYVSLLRKSRIEGLSGALGSHGVRESFDLSYNALDLQPRRLFGLLGLHPGDEFGAGVAAALLGTSTAEAGRTLQELADASLLIRTDVERYRFHDLVREYAEDQAPADRAAAVARMLDWYQFSAVAAEALIHDADLGQLVSRRSVDEVRVQAPADESAALDWYDTEWENLTALARWAAAAGEPDLTWQLPGLLWSYVALRRRWQDHRELYTAAVEAAKDQERLDGAAWVALYLGNTQLYIGDLAAAAESYQEVVRLSRLIGNTDREAAGHGNAGLVLHTMGDLRGAISCYEAALELERPGSGRAQTLNNLASCLRRLGALDEARAAAAEAAEVYRCLDQRSALGFAVGNLADVCLAQGDLEAARGYLSECLEIARDFEMVRLEAEACAVLALIHEAAGEAAAAATAARSAIDLMGRISTPETATIAERVEHLLG